MHAPSIGEGREWQVVHGHVFGLRQWASCSDVPYGGKRLHNTQATESITHRCGEVLGPLRTVYRMYTLLYRLLPRSQVVTRRKRHMFRICFSRSSTPSHFNHLLFSHPLYTIYSALIETLIMSSRLETLDEPIFRLVCYFIILPPIILPLNFTPPLPWDSPEYHDNHTCLNRLASLSLASRTTYSRLWRNQDDSFWRSILWQCKIGRPNGVSQTRKALARPLIHLDQPPHLHKLVMHLSCECCRTWPERLRELDQDDDSTSTCKVIV
jgi:hypothetical protein